MDGYLVAKIEFMSQSGGQNGDGIARAGPVERLRRGAGQKSDDPRQGPLTGSGF